MVTVSSKFMMTPELFLEYVRYSEYMSKRIDVISLIPISILYCSIFAFFLIFFDSSTNNFIVFLILVIALSLLYVFLIIYNLFYYFCQEPTSWRSKVTQEELRELYLNTLCLQKVDEFFQCASNINCKTITFDIDRTVFKKESSSTWWVKQTEHFFLVGCFTNREVMGRNWQWRSIFDRNVFKGIPSIPFKLDTLESDDLDNIKLLILNAAPRALSFKERKRLRSLQRNRSMER